MSELIDDTFGRRAERKAGHAIAQHVPVVPLGDLPPANGRGPSSMGPDGGHVLPDFAVGARTFGAIEVKLKSGCGWRNDWKRQEQGIDTRHFLAYQEYERNFRIRVVLLILERSTGHMLAATLDDLRALGQARYGNWTDGTPSVNWDRKAFTRVGIFRMPGEPETMEFSFDWPALDALARQLAIPFEEATHA